MKTLYFIIFVLMISLSACKKPSTTPNSGLYKGTYTSSINGVAEKSGNLVLALFESNSWYTVSGDTVNNVPVNHSGTWTILSANQINFETSHNVAQGLSPRDYLDTTYNYTFDDVNFTLNLKVDTLEYSYNLQRY